jgi:hypothetical protein
MNRKEVKMNKQEKLKQLTKQVEALKAEIEAERPLPQYGDEYYTVPDNVVGGGIDKTIWYGDESDRLCRLNKNIFQTYKAASAVRNAKLAICDLQDGFEPDWSDLGQEKWCVCCSHNTSRFVKDYALSTQHYGNIYFRDKKTAEKAIPYFEILKEQGAF